MEIKISIIIPTLNEAERISKTVGHFRRNGGENAFEILVIDGGSTDETVQRASEAGATVLISHEKGRAAQMNYGAVQSRGNLLYFVHADTIVPKTWAADLLAAWSSGHEMGCFRYKFDSLNWLLRFNSFFTRFSFLFCQGGDKTFFIRRNLFFQIGKYDPSYVIMEEYDFLRRARRRGHRLVVLPCECIVSARKYEQNSWLRVQLANAVVFNLWFWGLAKPATLKRAYSKMLR